MRIRGNGLLISITLAAVLSTVPCMYIPEKRNLEGKKMVEAQPKTKLPSLKDSFFSTILRSIGAGDFSEGDAGQEEGATISLPFYFKNDTGSGLNTETGYYVEGLGDIGHYLEDPVDLRPRKLLRSPLEIKSSGLRLRRSKREVRSPVLFQQPRRLSNKSQVAEIETRSTKVVRPKPKTCPAVPKKVPRSLACYQCNSTYRSGSRDEKCDSVLWGLTRASEKYEFQLRCPEDDGHFCVKKVAEKSGERITERGCLGPGPIVSEDGHRVPLKEGCAVYRQRGYITTSCLCKTDMCNAGPRLEFGPVGQGKAVTIVLLFLAVIIYGLVFICMINPNLLKD